MKQGFSQGIVPNTNANILGFFSNEIYNGMILFLFQYLQSTTER